jgi:outer membrane usher protein
VVVPANGAGVVVGFGVSQEHSSALVAFVGPNGKPIKAGSVLRLEGSNEEFIVGHDGEAFVHGLAALNTATIELADHTTCHADFAYAPKRGTQVKINGVVCQ